MSSSFTIPKKTGKKEQVQSKEGLSMVGETMKRDYLKIFFILVVLFWAMGSQASVVEFNGCGMTTGCAFETKEYFLQTPEETKVDSFGKSYKCRTDDTGINRILLCEGYTPPKSLDVFKLHRRLDCLMGFLNIARKNKLLDNDKINIIKDRLDKIRTEGGYRFFNGRYWIYYYHWNINFQAVQQTVIVCEREAGKNYATYYVKWNRERIKTCQERTTILNTWFKQQKMTHSKLEDYHTWAPESIGVVSARNIDYLEKEVIFYEQEGANDFQTFLEEWRRGVYPH